jgi:hypothetical protein
MVVAVALVQFIGWNNTLEGEAEHENLLLSPRKSLQERRVFLNITF